MMQTGIWALWLVLYWHEIEQVGDPEKGYGKRIAVWGMTLGILAGARPRREWRRLADGLP